MLSLGFAYPLLGFVFFGAAILSFIIQNADAAGETSSAFVQSKLSCKIPRRIKTSMAHDVRISNHYACPPTSVEALRKRYGSSKSVWGEWSNCDTRRFYKQQLPRALQIDGALGLSLEERAQLASAARHALRVYARERCHLPGRMIARLYDGIRHLQTFGYWSSTGMTWEEVLLKYQAQAKRQLGKDATEEDILEFVYKRILEKSCESNAAVDEMSIKQKKSSAANIFLRQASVKNLKTSTTTSTPTTTTSIPAGSMVYSYVNAAGSLVHTVLNSQQLACLSLISASNLPLISELTARCCDL